MDNTPLPLSTTSVPNINLLSFLFLKADVESDFKTKSILCMPIFNTNQKIVGEFVTVQTCTLLLEQ